MPANKRTKGCPGRILSEGMELPKGWALHPSVPNRITPLIGSHAGVPMRQDSETARLLGWPGPCETGYLNITVVYADGTSTNPHINALKRRDSGMYLKVHCMDCGSPHHTTYQHRTR